MSRHSPMSGETVAGGMQATAQLAHAERPGQAEAYFLLAKPGIVFAEVLACLAGALLAKTVSGGTGSIVFILFAVALAAGGAAMMNGILEQDLDRAMPRLARRCHALEIAGVGRVRVVALTLMAAGLALSVRTAPLQAALLLGVSCVAYLWLYTAWLKRLSPWGVLAGSIPGALPPLIGAAAAGDALSPAPLLLALFILIWQLPHFWLLALECSDQYARAGVPVLPLTHGALFTKKLTMATGLLLLPLSLAIGQTAHLPELFTVVAAATGVGFALLCAHCLYRTSDYRLCFRGSLTHLLAIFGVVCIIRLFS